MSLPVILLVNTALSVICLPSGAVNIGYATVRGSLTHLTEMEGSLAEPGQDFQPAFGSITLPDGQTSTFIPIEIIDVRCINILSKHNLNNRKNIAVSAYSLKKCYLTARK